MADGGVSASVLGQHVVIAGFANAAGQTVGHPFDLLKVRLQVQGRGQQLAKHERKYRGVLQGLQVMYAEGGVCGGLFSAWRVSAVREWWYSGLRMGLYEPVKFYVFNCRDRNHTPLYIKVAAGLSSGVIAATLSNPMDLIKVRFQVATGEEYRKLPSMWGALRGLYREGGIAGMWQGYTPNMLRAAGITGVQVASYDHIKHHVLQHGWLKEGYVLHFSASFLASLLAIMVTNPVDVIKTRMMQFNTYRSVRECGTKILRTEGPMAFYKGATVAWLRLGPHTVTTFMTFEAMRHLAGLQPI